MKRIEKYAPPGADVRRELIYYAVFGFIFIICFSIGFVFTYFSTLDSLYMYDHGRRVLIEGAEMEDINSLLRLKFAGFWGFAASCAVMAIAHYISFTNETRSIYVMKRLPDAKKLHMYCLTLPVLALLAGIVLTALLMHLYTQIYFHFTPAECMPEFSGLDIWGMLL
jgi:hypothetical protein